MIYEKLKESLESNKSLFGKDKHDPVYLTIFSDETSYAFLTAIEYFTNELGLPSIKHQNINAISYKFKTKYEAENFDYVFKKSYKETLNKYIQCTDKHWYDKMASFKESFQLSLISDNINEEFLVSQFNNTTAIFLANHNISYLKAKIFFEDFFYNISEDDFVEILVNKYLEFSNFFNSEQDSYSYVFDVKENIDYSNAFDASMTLFNIKTHIQEIIENIEHRFDQKIESERLLNILNRNYKFQDHIKLKEHSSKSDLINDCPKVLKTSKNEGLIPQADKYLLNKLKLGIFDENMSLYNFKNKEDASIKIERDLINVLFHFEAYSIANDIFISIEEITEEMNDKSFELIISELENIFEKY